MTPKDNELRIQAGFTVTHAAEHQLIVVDENGNWMCPLVALQKFADYVRADEREKLKDKE
jgi:hypothetical protein